MALQIAAAHAQWFLPFVLPVCLWVIWSDLSAMRIPNAAVLTLAAIFLVIGLIALPLPLYGWRLVSLVVVLVLGFVANMAGLMGAGDSKFLAAAAPFVAPGDVAGLAIIFSANLLACFATHRLAKYSALRRLAPGWQSWSRGRKFPMGFALGSTLVIYLALGAVLGA
jgi:prepilin peptidase CpaA